MATASSQKLVAMALIVMIEGTGRVKPFDCFIV